MSCSIESRSGHRTCVQLIAIANPIETAWLNVVQGNKIEITGYTMEVFDSELIESREQVLGNIYFVAAHCGRSNAAMLTYDDRMGSCLYSFAAPPAIFDSSGEGYHHCYRNLVRSDGWQADRQVGYRYKQQGKRLRSVLAGGTRPVLICGRGAGMSRPSISLIMASARSHFVLTVLTLLPTGSLGRKDDRLTEPECC